MTSETESAIKSDFIAEGTSPEKAANAARVASNLNLDNFFRVCAAYRETGLEPMKISTIVFRRRGKRCVR